MSIRDQLQKDLRSALKSRDKAAASVIRSVLAAIANAEAVDTGPEGPTTQPMGPAGLGSAEASRRELTPDDVQAILGAEIRERRTALADYERHGQREPAEKMARELAILGRYA